MKKLILLASALALGGAAYAQDASIQPPATTPDASASAPASPDGSMPQATPDASTAPATPDASTPPAATDSSMPAAGTGATAPMSGGAGTATGPSGPVSMTPTQGPTDLPTCSKTVTDNCKQGGGKSMAHKGHKMSHKRR